MNLGLQAVANRLPNRRRSTRGALIEGRARKAHVPDSGVLRLLRRQLELVGHSAELGKRVPAWKGSANTLIRRESINHLDDATRAWISDDDLFPDDDATIERGAITEWDLVVSQARIRQCVSDRHALYLWISLHFSSPHISEECRSLIGDDDDFGTFGAYRSVEKMTGRVQRVAGAEHRRRAGSCCDLEYFSFVGPGAHRCGSAPRPRPPSGGS
jgi:hypothetical protein